MTFSDQAIILKRHNLGEADRLITLLTRNRGKLTAVAKGVRKPTSRKGGNLELFNHVQGYFVETKGLPLLTEVQLLSSFAGIKQDLSKVGQGWYVCELVDSLLREGQESYQVFNLLLGVLKKIEKAVSRRQEAGRERLDLRNFEVQLLRVLGYWSDEVQGAKYPSDPNLQTRFNQALIQGIIEKGLKSPRLLKSL